MKSGVILMLAMMMLMSFSIIKVTARDQGQCEHECLDASIHCVKFAPTSTRRGNGTDPSVKWTNYCLDVLGTCLHACEPISIDRASTKRR